ncbi:MAG: carboxypeptidase-like regulatory domain-containing protein [Chloroflexota bacterium]|nr:carboxypeptidase-like regulatory domain-containing protein [Chloroflexota bacterium]
MSGTVYQDRSNERIQGALVTAQSDDYKTRVALTNDDGDFRFTNLEHGSWKFTVLHKDYRAPSERDLQIIKDKPDVNFKLLRLMATEDEPTGRRLFRRLAAALLLLALTYGVLHWFFPPQTEALSPSFEPLIDSALAQVGTTGDLNTNSALTTTVSEISNAISTLVTDTVALSTEERQVLDTAAGLVTRIETSIAQNNRNAAQTQLNTLRDVFNAPRAGSFFWVREPWRFLEVLFWGLAGILAQLIMTTGTYLRWGRFYKEGMPLHMAQLVTTPLTVLVIVLLLSLIRIQVTLSGGTEVNLDLRDPRLLAAVSFLLGIGPLLAWRFARNVSANILRQTKNDNERET